MTDCYNSLTVVLDRDIRDDDAQPLLDAIRLLKGVLKVSPHVARGTDYVGEMRAKNELRKKLLELLDGL